MRAVVLAGGYGTRLLPFTKILNKGLAPIYSPDGVIPQIILPLRTLVNSGVEDIMLISSRDHCGKLIELLGDGSDYKCNLTYKIQEMNRPISGIGQALKLARNFVGNDKFAVILGDNYYQDTFIEEFQLFEHIDKESAIFIKEVSDPHRFGVAEIDYSGRVIRIEEKPLNPKSNFAITGLYLYSYNVFDELDGLKASSRNELEITDINNFYINRNSMITYRINGYWRDMGTSSSAKEVIDFLWSL